MTVALALGMVVVAVVLFALERIPLEVSSLTLVVLLVVTGLLTPAEALGGFSSETVIFIFALLAMTQGLAATGVMQLVGRRLLFFARFGPRAFMAALLVAVCACSSVASNTAVTAAFLPVATSAAVRARVPPGVLLMPLAFASMLGGTIFLYGTSTNLVVSAAMQGLGLAPIGFAELAPVGVPLAALVLTLLIARGPRLIPARPGPSGERLADRREYLTEAVLSARSRLIGKPLSEVTEGLGIPVIGVIRQGIPLAVRPEHRLAASDRLVVGGSRADILRLRDLRSLGLRPDSRYERDGGERHPRVLLEVALLPTSSLVGRSLRSLRLAESHDLVVLAIHRHPALQRLAEPDLQRTVTGGELMAAVPLATGDVLLVSGPEPRVLALAEEAGLAVLGSVEHRRPRYRRAVLALGFFVLAVGSAAAGVLSPAIAGLAGMLLMIATGCVDARTAFRVDWRVAILVGSLLALGLAMEKSGAGLFVADRLLPVAAVAGPRGVLALVMLMTLVLSVPMSNQAAALVMLPIAFHTALALGVDPRPFAMGTCLSASCAFLTPLEPSAALVYGPGHYRFGDFLRVGTPLTALMLAFLTWAVPLVWPFTRP